MDNDNDLEVQKLPRQTTPQFVSMRIHPSRNLDFEEFCSGVGDEDEASLGFETVSIIFVVLATGVGVAVATVLVEYGLVAVGKKRNFKFALIPTK